jgi:hypothetical protein
MKDHFRFKALAVACAVTMLAAGCGSSSYDDPVPAPPAPPPSAPPPVDPMAQEDAAASASVAGLIAFIQTVLASLTLETNEPRNIDGITPPVSDTAEPTSI